jgi:hypothetical protein
MFKYIKFNEVQAEFTKLSFVQKNEEVKAIRFDKPIAALIADSEEQINELIAYQNPLIECELITYDEFKALVEMTSQYQRSIDVSNEVLVNAMKPIKAKYTQEEIDSWSKQVAEATKFAETKNAADAPRLTELALAENSTTEDFANAVLAKDEAFGIMHNQALIAMRAKRRELLMELGL